MLDGAMEALKEAELNDDAGTLYDARIAAIKAQDLYDETPNGRANLSRKIKGAETPEMAEALIIRKENAYKRYQDKENQSVRLSGKICRACKAKKPYEEYSNHKNNPDGLQYICNPCQSVRNKKYYRATPEKNEARKNYRTEKLKSVREITVPLLKRGCTDCGVYYEHAMDFDHIGNGKTIDISALPQQAISEEEMIQRLKTELKICEVRCANCHRIATYERQGKNSRLMFLTNPDSVSEKHKHVFRILEKSSCVDCNTKDLRVLEFDHMNSKVLEVSRMVKLKGFSIADIDAEIAKCKIRCVNCHRKKTFDLEHPEFSSKREDKYIPTVKDLTCQCGKTKTFGRMECPSCARKPKIDWPPIKELVAMIQETSYVRAGKALGVSDNGIRKHFRTNGIDPKTFQKY